MVTNREKIIRGKFQGQGRTGRNGRRRNVKIKVGRKPERLAVRNLLREYTKTTPVT